MTNRTCALRSNDSTPARRIAADSGPQVNEASRRARREQAIVEMLKAAAGFEEAGEPAYAAGCRANAARMQAALRSAVR